MQVPIRTSLSLFLAASVFVVVGCEQQNVPYTFVFSENTEALIPEAKDGIAESPGVKQMILERFGQPEELALWNDLPIEFGGIKGTVSKFEAGPDGTATVKLELKEEYISQIGRPAAQLQFTAGEAKLVICDVLSWDAETSTATISGLKDQAVAEGDKLIMDAGSNLRFGHQIYMQHCVHCHGTTGDGQGPTARYLKPRPRDFRHGISKFTSTDGRSKPAKADYVRTLREGIPGTYMPSFVPMLNDEKLNAVVEYVRFLSIRGEMERKLVNELAVDYSQSIYAERLADDETREEILEEFIEFMEEDMVDILDETGEDLIEDWEDAEDSVVIPDLGRMEDTAASRRRGRELYLSQALNCMGCHGAACEGNGPQSLIYEKHPDTQELYPEAGLHDIWHNVNQPRNLTRGIYRGGRRPIDLYRRLHAGIKGTRMPSFKSLPEEDIWHLVNYILSIPFEVDPGAAETKADEAAEANN